MRTRAHVERAAMDDPMPRCDQVSMRKGAFEPAEKDSERVLVGFTSRELLIVGGSAFAILYREMHLVADAFELTFANEINGAIAYTDIGGYGRPWSAKKSCVRSLSPTTSSIRTNTVWVEQEPGSGAKEIAEATIRKQLARSLAFCALLLFRSVTGVTFIVQFRQLGGALLLMRQ